MKTLTMTASDKQTKTIFQNANEGEQCRIASTADYLVGMESAKAGTVVKVTETNMNEQDTIKFYADYYVKEWRIDESDALEVAKEDVTLMQSLASMYEVGEKLLVKIAKSGRISVQNI